MRCPWLLCIGVRGSVARRCEHDAERKAIKTTQRITILYFSPHGATNVGTSDGRVGGRAVHGALRALVVDTSASTFKATATLFYPSGTLRYTLNGTKTATSSGGLSISASGKFTGGTGSYVGARGSFTATGTKPQNSYETWTLIGKVSYR